MCLSWAPLSFGLRPNFVPRAFAAARTLRVRPTIRLRSNSAVPPNTINTMRPSGVVVSAPGSARLRRRALASRIRLTISGRSRMLRVRRSSRRSSCGRARFLIRQVLVARRDGRIPDEECTRLNIVRGLVGGITRCLASAGVVGRVVRRAAGRRCGSTRTHARPLFDVRPFRRLERPSQRWACVCIPTDRGRASGSRRDKRARRRRHERRTEL